MLAAMPSVDATATLTATTRQPFRFHFEYGVPKPRRRGRPIRRTKKWIAWAKLRGIIPN